MVREAALGFDVGTTSVKAGLLWLDDDGPPEVASHPYPSDRPQLGWVEQDPDAWLATMATCWAELSARVGPARIRSVGVCSQVNTHVLVDAALSPLYPAITWQDTRAATEAAELDARVEGQRTKLWGGPFKIDASFALSRLDWLSRHQPSARRSARWLLSPRDYCVAALTGEVVTDPISPVGLVGVDDRYIGAVLELVEGAARLMPPIRPFEALAGMTDAKNAVGLPADVPVAVGTMDAWGAVYGSGLVRSGQAMEVAGTSEILAVLSDRAVPTPGVISFAPVHGLRLHAGPTQAAGSSLEWAARCFGKTIGEILALAEEAQQDPHPILFLPHLAGERAPHWNPAARGAFVGMTNSTELRHLALAVLEGVAFSARQVLARCEEAAGLVASELRLSGGAARSSTWNQVKASTHGRGISVLKTLDSSVLGAALMGEVAAGIEPDVETAAERRVKIAHLIGPDPAHQPRLDDLYETYCATYEALEPVFGRLSEGH